MDTTATTQHVLFRSFSASRVSATLCFSVGLVMCLLGFNPVPAQAQNTYTVDVTSDNGDVNPGDGDCLTSSFNCSLRAAIEEANASTNEDVIEFGDIAPAGGPAQIAPSSELVIAQTVTIDGSTENSYSGDAPTVLIDGSSLLPDDAGLYLEFGANGSTIQALAIVGAPDNGIDADSEVTIQDCYVGVSTDGTTANGNGDFGISLFGDDNAASGNVIGGNDLDGLLINGSNNVVSNNRVGIGSDGASDVGNGGAGIEVNGTNNFIGFCLFGSCAGNTISGNDGAGIQINANGQTVVANRIGTNESGTSSIPNNNGIAVESSNNTIGGTDDQRNVISGNQFNGIRIGVGGQTSANDNTVENNYIGTDASGTSAIPNGNGCVEGGVRFDNGSENTITANVIAGNTAHGVFIRGDSFRNGIFGNSIGTNSTSARLGNDCDGVQVDTAPSTLSDENEIHGGNVIGDNGQNGVDINGDFGKVTNNYIGTDNNGTNLANGGDGVNVSADFVLVGQSPSLSEDGNVIGFNDSDGIHVTNGNASNIKGNYIGTNASGDNLGNSSNGILIEATSGNSADGNVIGYPYSSSFTTPSPSNGGDGNVIANHINGVRFVGSGTMTNNPVRGNRIYNHTSFGIYLGSQYEGNDNGDESDTGDAPNRGQNYPVIEAVENCNDSGSPTTVDITYKVRSNDNSNASNYGNSGLKVDFYVADSESSGEGITYIQTETYNAPLNEVGTVLETDATCDDFFVATATDADGNTGQFFSPSQQLPVEITTFDAQADGETVQLSWTTASETNNAGFDVQRKRSSDEEWTKVGFVEGHGTTSEPQTYAFDDTGAPYAADSLSYRLKQVDLDGAFEYSEAVEVAIAAPEQLALHGNYPNPFADQTTIRYEVPQTSEVRVAVYNVLGQQVTTLVNGEQAAGRHQIRLDASRLSSGVYFVRLTSDGRTETQKLTVVR